MLKNRPPIKAALPGSAGSQSCETFLLKAGHNLPKWECRSTPLSSQHSGPASIAKSRPHEGDIIHVKRCSQVKFFLCSEQTMGNHGTQSFGTAGEEGFKRGPDSQVSRAARGIFWRFFYGEAGRASRKKGGDKREKGSTLFIT